MVNKKRLTPPIIMPGAEPFFFQGGPVGCLLIHGFTASPEEVRGLGEHLAAEGHTVYGLRLPHHGTYPHDMKRSHWRDWYFAALDGWHILQAQCEQVVAIGMSMGGATSLMLASQKPVAAVISMSTPIYIDLGWGINFARLIALVKPYLQKSPLPNTAPWQQRVDYRVRPLRSVAEFYDYMRAVGAVLPQVTVPALLIHSRSDDVALPDNMPQTYERLGSTIKQMVWIEDSDHVITVDRNKMQVWETVAGFIREHVSPGSGSDE